MRRMDKAGRRTAWRCMLYVFAAMVLVMAFATSAQAGTYYVAKTGNDTNPGTEAQPWLTITKAATTLVAGDTVYVKAGTYAERVVPVNSGAASAWIKYLVYPGNTVTIDGASVAPATWDWMGLVDIQEGKSYLEFNGFRVINSKWGGFVVNLPWNTQRCSNIVLRNNYVGYPQNTGILIAKSDNCIVDGNEVDNACQSAGETQEVITIQEYCNGIEVMNNYVHGLGPTTLGGEGIDIKSGSSNCTVHHNTVTGVRGVGIYIDAYASYQSDIEVYNNLVYNNTNCVKAICLEAEAGGTLENVHVYNNIIYGNRSCSALMAGSGEMQSASIIRNCSFINNTIYNNGSNLWDGQTGGIDIGNAMTQGSLHDIVIRNNICSQNVGIQIRVKTAPYIYNITVDHNLIDGFKGAVDETKGTNYVEGSPSFVNAAGADFHLLSNSIAIGAGSSVSAPAFDYDDNARPSGGSFDIGAYEYLSVVQPPVAQFVGNPTSGYLPLAVAFTDSSTNTPTSWSWNFGDSGTSTTQNPSHTYSSAGSYTVSLRATNASGYDDEVKTNYITANALPSPPVAAFSGTPTSGMAPLAVAFTDSSTNTPTAWSWNFGDSTTSTSQNPSHTYSTAGSYTVSLRATNAGGYDDEVKTNYLSVSVNPTPIFVAAGAVTSGTGTITPALPAGIASNDILVLFVESANQAASITNQNGGTWTAVTGSPQGTGTAGGTAATALTAFWSRYNGTQGAPTVSDSGNHTLGRIIAARGCVTSGNPWDVTAGGVEATADTSGAIPGATTTVANTLVVAAIATALPDASGTANFSAWTNANLTSLSERTDNTVTANNGGGLAVATGAKATAGAIGNTAVTCASSTVKGLLSIALKPAGAPAAPVANFTGSPTSGTAPLAVTFTDTSTNTPTSWSWNFGDSTTSTSQNPSHTYAAGTYTVALTATNAYGSDGETKTNYITATSGPTEVYVYPISWSTWAGTTLLSGALTDLQTDNNVYMVYRCNTSDQKTQVEYQWDTTYVPANLSKITVDLQFKGTRTDTSYGIVLWNYSTSAWDTLRTRSPWYTTDTDFTWETTNVSTYMNASGQMRLTYCGCPANSTNYDTSIDVTRMKLTLN